VAVNSRIWTAMLGGAIVGAVAGYVFFTEEGHRLRRQLEPALDYVAEELNTFRHTVEKAARVASDGWKLLEDAVSEQEGPRFQAARHSNPF
jgi:gas vesicle protein